MNAPISRLQLRRLQTLYSAALSRELGGDCSREARLAWASSAVGHSLASFSDLTSAEANRLIDTLQTEIGQLEPQPAMPPLLDRDRAQAAGTEGRKRSSRSLATLACTNDLKRIDKAVARLGWSDEHFQAWLRSSSSPLNGGAAIRTLGDANRVWWALKGMLRRQEMWSAPLSA